MPILLQNSLALLAAMTMATALAAGQEAPGTPAEQYKKLLKEHQLTGSGRVMSDEERVKFVGRAYQRRYELGVKLVDLAEKYPNDPIAFEALVQAVWQVNTTPWPVELVGTDPARPRAFAHLQRDHIRSDKLGLLCQRVSYGFCKEYGTVLRAVLESNPHREVLAHAHLALAHFLNNRLQKVELTKEQPQTAKDFEVLFGKEYLAELQRQDPAKVVTEAEALLEQAAAKYGDVKLGSESMVRERAVAELFEVRHLSVGKVVPDIEGEDQDGNKFKLSDYRGKVVLLDFWSQV